ncbi:hypothetical protein B0H14DRAFT_529101 [Mycena olivaceomarginata]|nr:hypothetical protein B0H14DRAFT_529101 [Mycena olivaceomarginata]
MTSSRPHRTQIKSMELVLLPAFINVVRRVIVECTHGADEPCGGDAVAARRGGLIVLVPACAHTDARHRLTVGRIREYRHPLPSLNNPQLDVELVDLIGPSERAFIARASRGADSPTSVRYREDDRWRSTGPQRHANRHCDFVCCVWCVARPAIVRYGSRHRLVPPRASRGVPIWKCRILHLKKFSLAVSFRMPAPVQNASKDSAAVAVHFCRQNTEIS